LSQIKHYKNDLAHFQNRFHAKYSCETQLISYTQEIFKKKIETGKQFFLIVMDFSKSVHKVEQKLLATQY